MFQKINSCLELASVNVRFLDSIVTSMLMMLHTKHFIFHLEESKATRCTELNMLKIKILIIILLSRSTGLFKTYTFCKGANNYDMGFWFINVFSGYQLKVGLECEFYLINQNQHFPLKVPILLNIPVLSKSLRSLRSPMFLLGEPDRCHCNLIIGVIHVTSQGF